MGREASSSPPGFRHSDFTDQAVDRRGRATVPVPSSDMLTPDT